MPWQLLARERSAVLRVVPIDESGQIRLDVLKGLLNGRTRLVAVAHVSNALGTVVPVAEVTRLAHRYGARVFVDGAQAAPHLQIDVRALGTDFYAFSGHKVYGPTGIGALYGRAELFDQWPQWQSGGNTIVNVTFDETEFQPPPARYEAGTGNIAGAVGLGAALDYVSALGLPAIERHERALVAYGIEVLTRVPRLHLVGTAGDRAGVLSFVIDGVSPHDVGVTLNQRGIAVRAGHHCAQPALRRFGLSASVRASLALCNSDRHRCAGGRARGVVMRKSLLIGTLAALSATTLLAQGRPKATVEPLVETDGVMRAARCVWRCVCHCPKVSTQSDKPRDPMLIATTLTATPPPGVVVGGDHLSGYDRLQAGWPTWRRWPCLSSSSSFTHPSRLIPRCRTARSACLCGFDIRRVTPPPASRRRVKRRTGP